MDRFALGLTIAAFMAGCGDSGTSGKKDAGPRMDAADARIVPDAFFVDTKPLTDANANQGDGSRADGSSTDSEADGSVQLPDAQPAVIDGAAIDAPADVVAVDAPADRPKRLDGAGDVAPACGEGATETCASPDNPLIGACHAGVRTCHAGVWGACDEVLPATRESCNGIDDDCNGMVDEGCATGCLVVCANCANGSDGGVANGSVDHPYATLEAAIAAASQDSTRKRICVVGGATCRESALYPVTGPLKMPDGLTIQGSYAITEDGLTYCGQAGVRPKTTLSFAASEGVVFDQTVVAGVELASMNIEINPASATGPAADTATAIAVRGGQNVRLSRVYVAEGFSADNTRGVSITSGGQALITGSSLSTGQGRKSAIGLYVNDGTANMRFNCDKIVNGRCESNCFDGGAMQGIHGYLPSNAEDAPAQSSGATVVAGSVSLVASMLCGGAASTSEAPTPAAVATLSCQGNGCTTIAGNVIVGGTDRDALAVALKGGSPALDSNRIYGGCGSRSTTGVRLEDSSARLQNNRVVSGECTSVDAPSFRGLHIVASATTASPDIHSNTIEPLGLTTACQSVGIQLDLAAGASTATSGVLRNNIVSAGICSTRTAIIEATGASLKSLLNNDLYAPQGTGAATTVLYRHGTAAATTAAQVNAISLAANNLSADPQYAAYPNDLHLGADSPCLDSGTSAGAPPTDSDGNARPAGEGFDIGAYELAM
jgi:hypothetical protein